MKRLLALILTTVTLPFSTTFALVLTGFGTGDFTVNSGVSNFTTITPGGSSLAVSGNDSPGNTFGGAFGPITFTLSSTSTVQLTMAVVGTNPNAAFSVNIYSGDLSSSKQYTGFTGSFGSSQTTVTLTPNILGNTGASSFTTISFFDFTTAGTGNTISLTFDTLAAVPEPSTYTLMAMGSLVFGGIFLKRKLGRI